MKHNHYFKSVRGLESIDVYRVLTLFGVTDPCLQHAVKKLLCAGYRGSKGFDRDVQEAIDTLARWKVMRLEDSHEIAHGGVTVTVNRRVEAGEVIYKKDLVEAEEPAAQMDDDSERMAAIGQNGNGGEHYLRAGMLCMLSPGDSVAYTNVGFPKHSSGEVMLIKADCGHWSVRSTAYSDAPQFLASPIHLEPIP